MRFLECGALPLELLNTDMRTGKIPRRLRRLLLLRSCDHRRRLCCRRRRCRYRRLHRRCSR